MILFITFLCYLKSLNAEDKSATNKTTTYTSILLFFAHADTLLFVGFLAVASSIVLAAFWLAGELVRFINRVICAATEQLRQIFANLA